LEKQVLDAVDSKEVTYEMKCLIFRLSDILKDYETVIKQKEVDVLVKDNLVKDKMLEKQDILSTLNGLSMNLERANGMLNAVTPRAIVEYVDNRIIKNPKMSREEKWESFLSKSEAGRELLKDILRTNPVWKNGKDVAAFVASTYRFSSDQAYSTAHEIAETQESILNRLNTHVQITNLASCLTAHFGLRLVDSRDAAAEETRRINGPSSLPDSQL
jgi:hypothetical protein